MPKYKIKINYTSDEIEAIDDEQATDIFLEELENKTQQTFQSFIEENIEIIDIAKTIKSHCTHNTTHINNLGICSDCGWEDPNTKIDYNKTYWEDIKCNKCNKLIMNIDNNRISHNDYPDTLSIICLECEEKELKELEQTYD